MVSFYKIHLWAETLAVFLHLLSLKGEPQPLLVLVVRLMPPNVELKILIPMTLKVKLILPYSVLIPPTLKCLQLAYNLFFLV